jgi:hypothetical protein
MRLSRKPYDVPLLLASGLLVGLYVLSGGGGFPLDDSWIHQVYARNLAWRGEWAFVPGQPSAASTSPLYTVLLAIGYSLHLPYLLWTSLLGVAALALTGMAGGRIADWLLPQRWLAGWAAGLVLVFSWHLIWAAAAGMETMLFSAFTLVLIGLGGWEWQAVRRDVRATVWRGAGFGGIAALAVMTRPEGALLAGLVGVLLLVLRPGGRLIGWWIVGAGVAFGVVVSPYLLLNLSLTGTPLPNTASAKQAQIAPRLMLSYPQRVADMIYPLIAGAQLLLVPGMIYGFWRNMRSAEWPRIFLALLLVLWPVALILLYAARLPAPYQHGRYVIPALPALIVLGVVGSFHLLDASRSHVLRRVTARALVICMVLTLVFFAFGPGLRAYETDVRIIQEEMVAPAQWIADNINTEDLLAVHDIGAVGYFAARPILDVAGLVSPEVVPIYHDEEALWALMRTRDVAYLMAFPDQLPGHDVTDARLCPVFASPGSTSSAQGAGKMVVYRLAWDGECNG